MSALAQQIRFARSNDGVRLACASSGSGPPLIKAATWLSHLEYDWESPVWSHLLNGAEESHRALRCHAEFGAEPFARTELYFGLSRPGGVITEADFKAFVDARVTPRFPDGLAVLSGVGQFRDASGTIVQEGSKLMVLLYPRRDPETDRKIEQILSDYKQQFSQQSVLRGDDLACVSF